MVDVILDEGKREELKENARINKAVVTDSNLDELEKFFARNPLDKVVEDNPDC